MNVSCCVERLIGSDMSVVSAGSQQERQDLQTQASSEVTMVLG